jgi:hypothetical protein
VGKFGLAAIGIAAIGLYLLIGDDEETSPEPAGISTLTQQGSEKPAPAARPPVSPSPYAPAPDWSRDRYTAPDAGYGYAPSTGYGYAGGGYPSAGVAPAPGYRFRPLEESEKQRLEQQSSVDYAATLDPYGLPARSGPGLAGMPGGGYSGAQAGMSPGYSATQNIDPYTPPPAGAFAPSTDPYAAPQQPTPAYGPDGWSRQRVPGYGDAPYSTQPPASGYGFRPLDSERPNRRWRDSYSTPPAYSHPQPNPSGAPRSRDWPPTAPGQRGTSADGGPLWAARGAWN